MSLPVFYDKSGEGVVSFEPWQTQGPEYERDHSRFYCHLNVGSERVFQYGAPCGTCGILFKKLKCIEDRITDAEAVKLLGNLASLPDEQTLRKLGKVLEPGSYNPLVLEGPIKTVRPLEPDDYFSTDVVRLFGLEPPEYKAPGGPNTPYYRFGTDFEIEQTGRHSGSHKALVTSVVMPIQDPESLNRERIEYWKMRWVQGEIPTALAVSVVDNQSPWDSPHDSSYKYKEQFLLSNCLLDGHHRIHAAAELGVSVRILAFACRQYSILNRESDYSEILLEYVREG